MPTKKQLDLIWESEFEFGLRNDEYSVQGSYNQDKSKDIKLTGEVVGTIRIDNETGEIIIEPKK